MTAIRQAQLPSDLKSIPTSSVLWSAGHQPTNRADEAASAFVLQSTSGAELVSIKQFFRGAGWFIGLAEYKAIERGLEVAHGIGIRDVEVRTSSKLVVEHRAGTRSVKGTDFMTVTKRLDHLKSALRHVEFIYFDRTSNPAANLAKAEFDAKATPSARKPHHTKPVLTSARSALATKDATSVRRTAELAKRKGLRALTVGECLAALYVEAPADLATIWGSEYPIEDFAVAVGLNPRGWANGWKPLSAPVAFEQAG